MRNPDLTPSGAFGNAAGMSVDATPKLPDHRLSHMIRLPVSLQLVLGVLLLVASPAAAEPKSTGAEPDGDLTVANGRMEIRVRAIGEGILRVSVRPLNVPSVADESWAVPLDTRNRAVRTLRIEHGFRTGALRVTVDPSTLALAVRDRAGRTIVADSEPPELLESGRFTLRRAIGAGERFYGLGDKTGDFDRRGQAFVNWNTDAYGFGRATDPIYKSIPFYIAIGAAGGAYGLFLDNSWRSGFDFGHREDGTLVIGADGGPIDYYLIAGPAIRDVVRRYAELTGKAPLPPLWSLGFHQSRYSYMSAQEVRQIVGRLRAERIPADVVWLDIDFQDRNRPFTTNPTTFPDLLALASEVGRDGIKLVAITDLHVAHAPNQGYAAYDSGLEGDHFLKNSDGSLYVAPVWPGPSVFPDFTRASTRGWWGDLYRGFIAAGIAGFWNDMNEPAIFETPTKTMPLDTVHRIEGDGFGSRRARHAEVHNVYGMLNSRATYEGLLRLRPGRRPYVMTRATYAGGQRYAVTWTGDNSSTWDHLKLSVQQMLSLGLSGFPWSGADVGGFIGGASPELMTRWYQIAAFKPVFRSHAGKDAPRAEPWVHGPEHLAIRRSAIEARYRLLPYLYAVAEDTSRTGDPIMRPTFYDYPAMASARCDQSMAFALGRDLLVAPPPNPESPHAYDICLPGNGWFDYWTGRRIEGDRVREIPRLERLPVFVRAGAIVPHQPLVQSTSEKPRGPLELRVYPGDDCRGELYFDDGETIAGPNLRQSIRCRTTASGLFVEFGPRQGTYRPWWSSIAITVLGRSSVTRIIPDQPRAATIEIRAR